MDDELDRDGLREGEELLAQGRHILGQRALVVRGKDGTIFVRLVTDGPPGGVAGPFGGHSAPPPRPVEEWVSAPVDGVARHVQIDMLGGVEGEFTARVVVVTQEGTVDRPRLVIRIYDDEGNVIETFEREAEFAFAFGQESEGRKAIVTRVVDTLIALIIDLHDGALLREGKIGRVEDEFVRDVVDLQLLGFAVVIVQRFRGDTWVRITLIGADGRILHVIDIPGRYVGATGNGKNGKVIATEKDGQIYQDLIRIDDLEEGSEDRPPEVRGFAENPVRGWFLHQQHDATEAGERWVLVVYDPDRDETTIRILGSDGRPTATVVLHGRPPEVDEWSRTLWLGSTFEQEDANTKLFVVERGGETEIVRVDLRTGTTSVALRLPGSFDGFERSDDGDLEVKTKLALRAAILGR